MNSGIIYVPDSHPTPSASRSGFGVFLWFFLVWSVAVLFGGVARLARFCCFAVCMHNACITIDGGRWPRQPPPPLGSSLQLSKSPRFLGQGRQPATCP